MSGETTAGVPQDIVVPDVQVEDSAQGPTTKATAKKVFPPKKGHWRQEGERQEGAKDEKAGDNWVNVSFLAFSHLSCILTFARLQEDENLESSLPPGQAENG